MFKRLRALAQYIDCRRLGHDEQCVVAVYQDLQTERHVHVCKACGATTKDVTTALSAEVADILRQAGLTLAPLPTPLSMTVHGAVEYLDRTH